jgi:YD repeat-containing protein
MLPITFQRLYSSDRTEDNGLGIGWSFTYNDRISLNGDRAILTTAAGSDIAFRREENSQRFVLKTVEPKAHQSFTVVSQDTITEKANGLNRTYKKIGDSYRLMQISDSNNNSINISFDSQGHITRISGDNGGAFVLAWSEGKAARLLSVTDNNGQRVSFRQDGQRLRAVQDTTGAQLTYVYKNGLLESAADPLGRIILRVAYNRLGRVIEAGDAAGSYHYQYDPASTTISQHTVVTDPIGVQTFYDQNESGLVTLVRASDGQTARFEYNAANRLVRISTSTGDETNITYDAKNRVLRESSTDGSDISYTYDEQGRVTSKTSGNERTDFTRDERGNVIAAKSSDPSRSYNATLDQRGRRLSVTTDTGYSFSSEYDASGDETAFTESLSGRFEIQRDAEGRVVSERSPSGLTLYKGYDSRGRLIKQSDNRGRSLSYERDASGSLLRLISGKGGWIRTTRDEAGRIIAVTNSAGKSRNFAYDARGALVDYGDARGTHKKLDYDQHGRLKTVTEDNGKRLDIKRDKHGRIELISVLNRTPFQYDYDQSGKLVAVKVRTGLAQEASSRVFSLAHALISPPLFVDCFFGNDGFADPMLIEGSSFAPEFGFGDSCDDPFGFGEMWGGFGSGLCGDGGDFSWYVDPWSMGGCGLFNGETHEQCVQRRSQICETNRRSCVTSAGGAFAVAAAACTIITLGNPVFGAICFAAALVKEGTDLYKCQNDAGNCVLEIRDKCPL